MSDQSPRRDPARPAGTDRPRRPDRAPWRTSLAALVVLAVVVGGALAWSGTRGTTSPGGPASSRPVTDDATVEAALTGRLSALTRAWSGRHRVAFVRAAGTSPASRAWAGRTYANLTALRVASIDLHLVDVPAPVNGGGIADVAVSWTPRATSGWPPTRVDGGVVALSLARTSDGPEITGTSRLSSHMPVWLLGRLVVTRSDDAMTVAVGSGSLARRVPRLTVQALHAVAAVVRRRLDFVAVLVPADVHQAAALLGPGSGGSTSNDLGQVAAVTTTIDGSTSHAAPVEVVLNPSVFGRLGARGAQVVLSHEATHAATGVATLNLPLWVAEGFADYVALHSGLVPLRVAAGQFFAYVRAHGPPQRLPTRADFNATSHGFGRTYEEAWTAMYYLGQRFGTAHVVHFYDLVRRGLSVSQAAARTFGLSVKGLTTDWSRYVATASRG
ncbi:MAG: hypothetical protein ACRDP1_17250 [Nocardioidaceae bacterium]